MEQDAYQRLVRYPNAWEDNPVSDSDKDTAVANREQKALTSLLNNFIKAETNLERLPFFAPWTKSRSSKLRHSLHRKTTRNGVDVEISWTVSANPEYGYPNAFDLDVYRAVQQIIHDYYHSHVPDDGVIAFSFRQLEQRMQQEPSGRLKKDIRASLERLVATTIKSKGMFFFKGAQQYVDDTFHIFDRVTFIGQTLPGGHTADTNYIELSRWYRESLRAWYVMPLDNRFHFSLRSSSAKALYGLLSFYFYCRPEGQEWVRRKYSDLCEETIISRAKYFSTGIQNLQNAFDELIKKELLAKVEMEPTDKTDGWIYFWPGERVLHPERFHRDENQPLLWDDRKADVPPLAPPPATDPEQITEEVAVLITRFYAALNHRESTRRAISQAERRLVEQWVRDHGTQCFADFITYALEQKQSRWPELASLTGAINAYGDEFLRQAEKNQQILNEEQKALEAFEQTETLHHEYRQYLEQRLRDIEISYPDAFAQYQKALQANLQYQQLSKSVQNGGTHWQRSKETMEENIATRIFSPTAATPIPPQAYILDFVDWQDQHGS